MKNISKNLAKHSIKIIKEKVRDKVFDTLKEIQSTHTKIRDVCYKEFKIQDYMRSHTLNNHEVSLLFSIRSRTVKNVANNFGQKMMCAFGCRVMEDQEHIFDCTYLKNGTNTSEVITLYSDIYGSLYQQVNVVKKFDKMLENGEKLKIHMETLCSPVAEAGPRPMSGL